MYREVERLMDQNFKWLIWKAENLPDKTSAKQMLEHLKNSEKELRKIANEYRDKNQDWTDNIWIVLKRVLGDE